MINRRGFLRGALAAGVAAIAPWKPKAGEWVQFTISGTNGYGPVTETIVAPYLDGANTFPGVKAFRTISSIQATFSTRQ